MPEGGRHCQENPADIQYLARNTVYEEAPAAPSDTDVISGERRTFDFMKDNSFVQKREEIAAKAREEQKIRESRKKEREKKGICGGEELEKKTDWGSENDNPEMKNNLSLISWNYTMFYFHKLFHGFFLSIFFMDFT